MFITFFHLNIDQYITERYQLYLSKSVAVNSGCIVSHFLLMSTLLVSLSFKICSNTLHALETRLMVL